mmetsp:Transcript_77033/g.178655  ORF Transcript_77033/g.178655 Transcript_77033/m.178655 type:complete len:302 (+) Transcript_77033:374-1279(+)
MHYRAPRSHVAPVHGAGARRGAVLEARGAVFTRAGHVRHSECSFGTHLPQRAGGRRCGCHRPFHKLLAHLAIEDPATLDAQEHGPADLHALRHGHKRTLLGALADLAGVGEGATGAQRDAIVCGNCVVPFSPLNVDLGEAQPGAVAWLHVDGPALGPRNAQVRCALALAPLNDADELAFLYPRGQLLALPPVGAGAQGHALGIHDNIVPLTKLRGPQLGSLANGRRLCHLPVAKRFRLCGLLCGGALHEWPPIREIHHPATAVCEPQEGAPHLDGPDALVDEHTVAQPEVRVVAGLGRPTR